MECISLIYQILNLPKIGIVQTNKILSSLNECINYNMIENSIIKDKLKDILPPEKLNLIFENNERLKIELNKAKEKNVKFLINFSHDYPLEIKKLLLKNSPPIISYCGNMKLLENKKIGFCGSRKASEKGLSVARDISQQISEKNLVIVSGYASGIDQETHYWALKNGGSTIIVLPEGINNFKIKRYIKDVWDWNRVLVLSEFVPHAIWSANRAMQRNHTIIALSDIMILIEAREKGGSIEAGYKTLQMKKLLFAPIYDDMSEDALGNQILLNKGAVPIRKKRDINRANLESLFKALESNYIENKLF
ncbi:MAG: DNA-processing protein DprA [Ignavibacteriales bacterium]|nr:DNA-processing protein DprA [Ignavibacteriales bacterium]